MHALTSRLEELARALERSGAPAADAARLLELASVATIKALALSETLDERPARKAPPADEGAPRVEPPLRRAA